MRAVRKHNSIIGQPPTTDRSNHLWSGINSTHAHTHAGHPGQWLRAESATTTAPETHDSPPAAGCYADPISVALLCSRRAFHLDSNMENSSGPTAESAAIVSIPHNLPYAVKNRTTSTTYSVYVVIKLKACCLAPHRLR